MSNGERTMSKQQVLDAIELAFEGVVLGEGVSLHETIVIDGYGSTEDRAAARVADEKHDWRGLVTDPDLAHIRWVGGLSFYDAEGLRFHLPAYLSLAVVDFDRPDAEALESLMYHLTSLAPYNLGRHSLLNTAQRRCVRDMLVFLRSEYELEDPELDAAIDGYWSS